MNELALVRKEPFGAVECDFYRQGKDVLMTRRQIGSALEYSDPDNAITLIHNRNKERMDKFSLVCQIDTSGQRRETYFYSARGVYEICRYSTQPKAHLFFDFVYDVLEAIRTGEISHDDFAASKYLPPFAMIQKLKAELGEKGATKVIVAYIKAQPREQIYKRVKAPTVNKCAEFEHDVKAFASDYLIQVPEAFTASADIYEKYKQWASESGANATDINTVMSILKNAFTFLKPHVRNGQRGYKNLKIK